MRFKEYLEEKYLATYTDKPDEWSMVSMPTSISSKIGEQYREIYINPTQIEVKNLVKTSGIRKMRFLAIPSQKELIIWPYPAQIHHNMFMWLRKRGYIKGTIARGHFVAGGSDYIEGFITADTSGKMQIDEPAEGSSWVNYSFKIPVDYLKKYISNYGEWMNDVEKEYHRYGYEGYLEERYLGSYYVASEHFDEDRLAIYVNPDAKDMQQFRLNGMRFIADPNKEKLYVWDEEVEIHVSMLKHLIKKGLIPITEKYLSGTLLIGSCEVSGPKMIINDIYIDKDIRGQEWKWLDKYFSNRRGMIFRVK